MPRLVRKYIIKIIMKKMLLFFAVLALFLPRSVLAQGTGQAGYTIEEFKSNIVLQKDASLLVTENIKANFHEARHGIFRFIPVNYSDGVKNIKANLDVISVNDGLGNPYTYKTTREGQSIRIKIGDADKTISGRHTYVINYKIADVVQRYDDHDEIYWNVTGSNWDAPIISSSASVVSEFARINKVKCFAGSFGTKEELCSAANDNSTAHFEAQTTLGNNKDFTVVVALDKNNQLVFPSLLKRVITTILDNWFYLLSFIPFGLFYYFWSRKGRDKRHLTDNIYYKPDKKEEIIKPIFKREFLPTVYHPIDGLTPAEVGTITDERVDIRDIVGEILELARLGYLEIRKVEKKKLIGKDTDYLFIKKENDEKILNKYQKYLYKEIFLKTYSSKSVKNIYDYYKKGSKELKDIEKLAANGELVLLSSMKEEFYSSLPKFKDKLYDELAVHGVFDGRPDKVRLKWIGIFMIVEFISFWFTIFLSTTNSNFGPIILQGILTIPSFIFAFSMPRRTAWGYSLYRQTKGLASYLGVGKWKQEIAEKNLFLDEMLPLAVSLNVVNKLAKDMEVLGVKPPAYMNGFTAATFASEISSFESSTGSTLLSSPWSGGSGFSGGGSSGGGFGGGGGGSW